MADVFDTAVKKARERALRRLTVATGMAADPVPALAASLTQTGGSPEKVARIMAHVCARMATDPGGFYEAAYLLSRPLQERCSALEEFFQGLLYGRNGLLHWSSLSKLAEDRISQDELRALLAKVRRARFARSEATESVSLGVLQQGRTAAEAIAEWLQLRNINVATLPTRTSLSAKVQELVDLEPSLEDLSSVEGRYRTAKFRQVALRRVLDTVDSDLSLLLHRLQSGEVEAEVSPDALASLAVLDAVVSALLVAPDTFGELLFPAVVVEAFEPPTLREVSLVPIPEFRYGHHHTAMRVETTDEDDRFRLHMNEDGGGWYEQVLQIQPLDTRELVAEFQRVDELIVEGTGTLVRTVGTITGTIVSADGTSPSKYAELEDVTDFTALNDASNASGDTDFWIRVGGEFDGKVFPVSGVAGSNLVLNSDDDPYDWGAEAVAPIADIEDYVGDTCIVCWASDRLLVDGYPAGQITAFSEADVTLQFSVRDPMASLWPFSGTYPLDHESAVASFGYGTSGSTQDYFGVRFSTPFLSDAKLVDSTWSVDFLLTRASGSRTIKLSQSWSTAEAGIVQRDLQGRKVTLKSSSSEARYLVTSVQVVEDSFALYDAVAGDVLVTFSEDVAQGSGSLLIDRAFEAPAPEGEYRWWRASSPDNEVVTLAPGDVIYTEAGKATVLSTAGDAVLLSTSLASPTASSWVDARRFRWAKEGDHVVDWASDEKLTWKIEELGFAGAIVTSAHTAASRVPLGGVISKGLVTANLGRKTRLFSVYDAEGNLLDLHSMDRDLRRVIGNQDVWDTSDSSQPRDWTIVTRGEPHQVSRIGRYQVRLDTVALPWDTSSLSAWVVVRTRDDAKDISYGVAEAFDLIGEGTIASRHVAGTLVLDLESNYRAKAASGRVLNEVGTTVIRAAHPVRQRVSGPAYRGGHPLFPRWALLSYRLQRRDASVPDEEELRRVLGRAFEDLGETVLQETAATVTLEEDGRVCTLDVAGLSSALLPGLDVLIEGEEPAVPPRVEAVLSADGSSYRVLLSREAEGVATNTAFSATLRETTLTSAFRRVAQVVDYLRLIGTPLQAMRQVDKPFLGRMAADLETSGFSATAQLLRSAAFESWSNPARYRTNDTELSSRMSALLDAMGNQRNVPIP